MLNSILNPITVPTFLICLVVSLALGILTALVFMYKSHSSASFALTLALLPMVVAVVIMMVNGNIGTGIAVAGAFTLVRFRSVPGTAREIAAIFITMAIGLAMGMGYVVVAVLLFLFSAVTVLVLTTVRFGEMGRREKLLHITLPENVNYEGLFDDLFERFGIKAELLRIRTTNMGTLFELTYLLQMSNTMLPKELMDELRTRNGNLNITFGDITDRETL